MMRPRNQNTPNAQDNPQFENDSFLSSSETLFRPSAKKKQEMLDQQNNYFSAIEKDDADAIARLITGLSRQRDYYLQFMNQRGETGLIYAVRRKAYAAIEYLLSEGIAIDACDHTGNTALHWAVLEQDLRALNLLLTHNASITCTDAMGYTPQSLAESKQYDAIVSRFKEVINFNYHAEKLDLYEDIKNLTNGEDIISKVSCALQEYMRERDLAFYLNPLESLYKQLLQPEQLLQQEDMVCVQSNEPVARTSRKHILTRKKSEIKEDFPSQELTKDSKVFNKINKLINDIDYFNQSISNVNTQSLILASTLLNKAKEYYLEFRKEVCQAKGRRRLELCAGRARISGFLGSYYLNAGATYRFTKGGKDNNHGTHAVLELGDTFYKIRPTAPGVEHAFHSLNTIITGQGSAPTELLIFENREKTFPIIASKAVRGENFATVLDHHPEWVEKLDSFNYTAHVILALVACPSDVKPDNYMTMIERDLKDKDDINRIKLIGIDNDLAFDPPYMALPTLAQRKGKITNTPSSQIKHFVDLKCVFFCMEQIHQVIDPGFRQIFINQSPILIILKWLKQLLLQEESYLQFGKNSKIHGVVTDDHQNTKEFEKMRVPVKFLPGTIKVVYQRLCNIQSLMVNNSRLTHKKLLKEIYPTLSACYDYVCNKESDIYDRIDAMYHLPDIQEIPDLKLTTLMEKELETYTRTHEMVRCERTESLAEAAMSFINDIDYSMLDDRTQGYILEKIGSDFSILENFVFRNSKTLTDERLDILAQRVKKIASLKLIGCNQVDGSGLSAILCYHPDAKICLQEFESVSVPNLLSLLQHCNDLSLILEGQEYTLKNLASYAALFKHALQNEAHTSLVTALLLSGILLKFGRGFQSPLHTAIEEGKDIVVRELIRYGASLNQLNNEGKSPLDYAIEGYDKQTEGSQKQLYQRIIFILVSKGAIEVRQAAPARVLELLPDDEFSLEMKERLWIFVCCHNLLTAYWIDKLIPQELSTLDFSPSKMFSMATIRLTEVLLDAIHDKLPSLKVFNIRGCAGLTRDLLQKITSWKLDAIIIDYNQAKQCGFAILDDLTGYLSFMADHGVEIRITHLTITKQKFSEAQLQRLSTFICKNEYLEKIELISCHLDPGQIRIMVENLAMNKTLKSINLTRNPLGDEGISILIRALMQAKHSALQELFLDETGAGVESGKELGILLKDHTFLENLSLYNNPLGDEGVEELAKGLELRHQENKKRAQGNVLKRLTLNEVNMSEEGAYHLSQALSFLKTLISLDVGYNPLGKEGADYFIQLLQLNTSLIDFKCDGEHISKIPDYEKQQIQNQIDKNRQRFQKDNLKKIGAESQPLWQQRVPSLLPPEYREIESLQLQNASLRQLLMTGLEAKQDNNEKSEKFQEKSIKSDRTFFGARQWATVRPNSAKSNTSSGEATMKITNGSGKQ